MARKNTPKEPAPVMDTSDSSWHWDRKIPVALIVTIVLVFAGQTATASWWAARMDSRVEALEKAGNLATPVVASQGERLTRVEERINAVQSTVQTGFADVKALLQNTPINFSAQPPKRPN